MAQAAQSKPSDKKEKSAAPAVEKALDILELLADTEDGMTANEMAEALGRTMGEIYRIIVYLTDRDYLAQDPATSRYALTLRLFELSHRHDPTERLIGKAVPVLERIAAKTEQSCHIGVLNRTKVMVLASAASPRPAGYAVRTGALFDVDRTSSGHVILAFSSDDAQARYLDRLPSADRDAARTRLDSIRARGFEDTDSTMIHGVRNLCVPVFDSRGIAAAITTGFISQTDQKVSPADALAVLSEAAQDLSHALGFRKEDSVFADAFPVLAPRGD